MFVSRPIDLAAEYAKVDDELKEINDPLMQVNAMKHKLVAERLDHQRTKEERLEERLEFKKDAEAKGIELGELRSQKLLANTKYLKLIVPVRVRHYVYFMEERFGNSLTSVVSPAIQTRAVKGKKLSQHILDRMFKWFNMLTSQQQDQYVSILLKELDNDFIKTGQTIMSGNQMTPEYEKYLLDFSESIARSCEQANTFITHLQSGQHKEISEVGFFDPVTDKAMTLFYNALIGTQKIILMTSTTASYTASVP